MRQVTLYISLLLIVLSMVSCDKTPRGVISTDDMAELIADLQIADAYIDSHMDEFPNDSSKQVLKQSIFKKYGITSAEYDSSLVWYAHNMEDYIKAHDQAVGILQKRIDKITKNNKLPDEADRTLPGEPTHGVFPRSGINGPLGGKFNHMSDNKRGDRYQLAYKIGRGDNEFKVSLNVDYIDGSTSQNARATYGDGWVTVDVQSDTARQVRRVYGYVSYNIKPGHVAYVDSLMLIRTRMSGSNYGIINAQRKLERRKK